MNKRVIVKRIKKEDIDFVIENIRDADKREIEDASGLNHKDCLKRIHTFNEDGWAAFIEGDLVAIFGVQMASYITGNGVAWLISTKLVEKHPITFIRHCRPIFKKVFAGCKTIFNMVDDRNHLAKTWLKWLGFKLEEPQPFGAKQLPYRAFKMEIK